MKHYLKSRKAGVGKIMRASLLFETKMCIHLFFLQDE